MGFEISTIHASPEGFWGLSIVIMNSTILPTPCTLKYSQYDPCKVVYEKKISRHLPLQFPLQTCVAILCGKMFVLVQMRCFETRGEKSIQREACYCTEEDVNDDETKNQKPKEFPPVCTKLVPFHIGSIISKAPVKFNSYLVPCTQYSSHGKIVLYVCPSIHIQLIIPRAPPRRGFPFCARSLQYLT